MGKYIVKFYKGNYKTRQRNANKDGCVLYVEHHFNSSKKNPNANYSVVIVGKNASQKSKDVGRDYTKRVSKFFGTDIGGNDGILIGGYGGHGNYNLKFTSMPAILLEPLFASNCKHAKWIKNDTDILAKLLVGTIRNAFPNGGLIAFSVGHKYKTTNPWDRGAKINGGGTEADYAEKVLLMAKEILISGTINKEETEKVKVVVNDQLEYSIGVSGDDEIRWNELQKKLYIYKR